MQQLIVEHRHHEGGAHVHQEGTHSDEGYILENVSFRLPSVGLEADERGGLDEMQHSHDGGGGHRDGGGPGSAGDAQVHPEDEDGVQYHIQNCAAHHNEHRLHRIARGADQAGEVEGHCGEEHSRQHDEQILARVGECLCCGAEAGQDAVHKQVAARHEQHAQHNGEYHTVAQNLLGPVHVLAPQHDRHTGRRAHANERAECVYDVHNGHRDGEAGNGHSAHAVPDEDPVHDIIDGCDDLADDGG